MKRILLLLLLAHSASFAQGPLAPSSTAGPQVGPVPALDGSGNPQPTMKTLHQVEPRTAVQTLAATAPYTISQPGSYYLTANISVTAGDAIVINSDDVTLDLNGFALISTQSGGSSGAAVSIASARTRIAVRNGSIKGATTVSGAGVATKGGFDTGIGNSPSGTISQILVSDVQVTGVGTTGIELYGITTVVRCTAQNCGSNGIYATTVTDSTAYKCRNTGVFADGSASNCVGDGILVSGVGAIDAVNCHGSSSSGTGVSATTNATNCSGSSATGVGLSATNASNCTGSTGGTLATQVGLSCTGTASSCRGTGGGGLSKALRAAIAIGCTYSSGTLDVPAGKSFNM